MDNAYDYYLFKLQARTSPNPKEESGEGEQKENSIAALG